MLLLAYTWYYLSRNNAVILMILQKNSITSKIKNRKYKKNGKDGKMMKDRGREKYNLSEISDTMLHSRIFWLENQIIGNLDPYIWNVLLTECTTQSRYS